jgi:hypothetical protein
VPASFPVHVGNGTAESEHACVPREVEPLHFVRRADRPMMCVVEERPNVAAPDLPHEPRFVPLVDERKVDALESLVHVGLTVVCAAGQPGERCPELRERPRVLAEEVPSAPALLRLEDYRFVPPGREFPDDASQEMSVAVVPVGHERVDEERDPHAAAPAGTRA